MRGRSRYKGTTPFQDDALDRCIFFGRDRESRSLLSLVLAERLIVLFAKAGIGKSSLINAGLLEPLRHRGYFPMSIRLVDQEQGPLSSVFDGISRIAQEARVEYTGGDESNLRRFFETVELWSETNDLLKPVLIVDQFEELFTLHAPERRREFIAELAELVRDGPAGLKVVLALREDFLAHLEELAREIPGILHHRFRLGPLRLGDARQAIVEPARLDGTAFETTVFSYQEEAVDEILTFLARRRHAETLVESNEVEPVQLQLMCQYLEEKVRARQCEDAGRDVQVKKGDVGGEAEMKKVLEGFYDRTVAAVWPPHERRQVRTLCEKRLIGAGERRLTEHEEQISRKYKVSKEVLRQLVDARLLRSEPRLGGAFYELSHDTLVKPILQSRAKRIKRQRLTMAGAVGGVLVALVFLGVWRRAQEFLLAAEKKSLMEMIEPAAPEIVFDSFWRLVSDHDVAVESIESHLLRYEALPELFAHGPGEVDEERRGEAVLRVVEVVRPHFVDKPDDLRAIGAVVWALDYFPGRDEHLAGQARTLREEVLAPLRSLRPPPGPQALDWVDVPGGSFMMGSEEGEGYPNERPRHPVTVGGFHMLAHEVTNADFRRLVPDHGDPPDGDELPAGFVDWYEAYAYAAWLGGRLPTEAEWEYAARRGCEHPYCDREGNEVSVDDVAWYDEIPVVQLHEPCRKGPNPDGLCDMHGNAWEWVADWYDSYSPEAATDPWGPARGEHRVFRGGGFLVSASRTRSADRGWRLPGNRDLFQGFRVVLPVPEPALDGRSLIIEQVGKPGSPGNERQDLPPGDEE